RYGRGRLLHLLGEALTYGLALYAFGYGWAVQSLWATKGGLLPGTELLLLAPFCVALVLSWACFYDAERALAGDRRERGGRGPAGAGAALPPRRFCGRAAYVGFLARQNLALVLLPILLLLTEKELRRQFPALNQRWQVQASVLGVAFALVVFVT